MKYRLVGAVALHMRQWTYVLGCVAASVFNEAHI